MGHCAAETAEARRRVPLVRAVGLEPTSGLRPPDPKSGACLIWKAPCRQAGAMGPRPPVRLSSSLALRTG